MNCDIYNKIQEIGTDEIQDILQAVLRRYNQLYPNWEISIISIEKGKDREAQLDRAIALLESMKKLP